MGSTQSSSMNKKQSTDNVQIIQQQKLPQISNNQHTKFQFISTVHSPNQQFTTSVQQMKFSKRNDLFKERSKQTLLQLNQALQNLKRNQLLSTLQFKKLQKTEHIVPIKINPNQQNKQRYNYKKVPSKRSQLAVREKRAESSIEISSVSSKYVNEPMLLGKNDLDEITQIKQQKPSSKINNIIIKRKKQAISQNINQKSQNQHLVNHIKLIQNTPIIHDDGNQILDSKKMEIKRRKAKSVKSQKFILHNLKHNEGLNEIAVLQEINE